MLVRPYFARYVRRAFGVRMADVEGLGHLQRSLDRGAGIMLAANHARPADPVVLALAGARLRQYFYYLTSFHLFQQRRLEAWKLKRFGAMSVLRDTTDHQALRACVEIVGEAQRPLVVFPEGTYFRQNDRLGPLQGGVSLICRRAARTTDRPILVHPVAIKYWFIGDAEQAVLVRLEQVERRFRLQPQPARSPLERVLRITETALSIVEREFLGYTIAGGLEDRIHAVADTLLGRIEPPNDGPPRGTLLERIRRLRRTRVNRLAEVANRKDEFPVLCAELDLLYLCQLLYAQSPGYLVEEPSAERLAEALQRLDEDWFDTDYPVAGMSAVVQFAPAIDAREFGHGHSETDPLTAAIGRGIRENLEEVIRRGRPQLRARRRVREFSLPHAAISLDVSIARLRATARALPDCQPVA